MDDRCRSGFALVKGFVRELTHVAEVTECVDLIELGCMCTSHADRNPSGFVSYHDHRDKGVQPFGARLVFTGGYV